MTRIHCRPATAWLVHRATATTGRRKLSYWESIMTKETDRKAVALKAPKIEEKKGAKAHFEVERGYEISPEVYASLGAKLESAGFKLESTSVITDTLLSTEKKGDTHRVRRQQFVGCRKPVIRFEHTYKSHPKMPKGTHVRLEQDPEITAAEAEELLTRYTHETCAPLPVYSKLRRAYVGKWKKVQFTVALDLALGLGHYSGHNVEFEVLIPVDTASVEEVQRDIDEYAPEIEEVEGKIVRFARRLLGDDMQPTISYRKKRMKTWGVGGEAK
jgi:hypothetical protein